MDFPSRFPGLLFLFLLFFASAWFCSCSPPGPKGDPHLRDVPKVVLAFKDIKTLDWKTTSTALPPALQKATRLVLGSQTGAGTLLGSEKGLYSFSNGSLKEVDQLPVRALTPWQKNYLAIARVKVVQFWDGIMHDARLFEQSDRSAILAMASWADNKLWFGTENQLWLLHKDKLTSYKQFKGVRSIATWHRAKRIVLQTSDKTFHLLRMEKDSLESRKLGSDKVAFSQVVLGPKGRLWALAQGALYTEDSGEKGWKQVQIPLDAEEKSFATIQKLTFSPSTGHLWVLGTKAFYLLDPKGVWHRQKTSRELKSSPSLAQVGQSQVLWWLQDGKLWRLSATTSGKVSYGNDVAPFLQRNCLRCHGELGPGRKLLTLQNVKDNIKEMIDSLEKGRMPPDQKPLEGGNVELLKRWLSDGLLP